MRNTQPIPTTPIEVPGAMPFRAGLPTRIFVERSRRFPIQTQLRFRPKGTSEWHETTTVNISRTGVLFEAPQKLPVNTLLEMEILFPARITRGVPSNVICCGPVVRTEASQAAAALLQYRFRRISA